MVTDGAELRGPLVKAAFLCETVLDQKDGVNSYIRVVERLGIEEHRINPSPPSEADPVAIPKATDQVLLSPWLVVMLAAAGAVGPYEVSIEIETPSGRRYPLSPGPQKVSFDERHTSAVNIHAHLNLVVQTAGDYTIHVFVDGGDGRREITRVPFEVAIWAR